MDEYEFEVQGYYNFEWEVVDTQPTHEEGRASLLTYRANEKGTLFRMRRMPIKEAS